MEISDERMHLTHTQMKLKMEVQFLVQRKPMQITRGHSER